MPRARYTADGGTYRVGGISFDPGQEREVDHDLANHLADVDDFDVIVEKDTREDAGESESESDGDSDASDDADSEESESTGEFDAAEFVDRTPMDSVIEDIHAGEADGHLDAVAEAASRVGVEDAVGERRAELEG